MKMSLRKPTVINIQDAFEELYMKSPLPQIYSEENDDFARISAPPKIVSHTLGQYRSPQPQSLKTSFLGNLKKKGTILNEVSSTCNTTNYNLNKFISRIPERSVVDHVSHSDKENESLPSDKLQSCSDVYNHKVLSAKEAAKPETTLHLWIIKLIPQYEGICVEGKKNLEDEEFWHSSLIARRISRTCVETNTGSRYRLVGDLIECDAIAAGISQKLVNAFYDGFPEEWDSLVEEYYSSLPPEETGDDTEPQSQISAPLGSQERPEDDIRAVHTHVVSAGVDNTNGYSSDESELSNTNDQILQQKAFTSTTKNKSSKSDHRKNNVTENQNKANNFNPPDEEVCERIKNTRSGRYGNCVNKPGRAVENNGNNSLQRKTRSKSALRRKHTKASEVTDGIPLTESNFNHVMTSGQESTLDTPDDGKISKSTRPSRAKKAKTSEKHNLEKCNTDVNNDDHDNVHGGDSSNGSRNKEIELYLWIIRPVTHLEGICVEGKKPGCDEYWHSSVISDAVDEKTVKTNSGTIYKLNGKIEKEDALDAGMSKKIVNAFQNGFPKDWKDYVQAFFKQKRRKKKAIAKNKSDNTENSMDTSVCTSNGQVVDFSKLHKTRSGRFVKPQLAWWAGQRLNVDSANDSVILTHRTSHAEEVFKELTETVMNSVKKNIRSGKTVSSTRNTMASEIEMFEEIHQQKKQNSEVDNQKLTRLSPQRKMKQGNQSDVQESKNKSQTKYLRLSLEKINFEEEEYNKVINSNGNSLETLDSNKNIKMKIGDSNEKPNVNEFTEAVESANSSNENTVVQRSSDSSRRRLRSKQTVNYKDLSDGEISKLAEKSSKKTKTAIDLPRKRNVKVSKRTKCEGNEECVLKNKSAPPQKRFRPNSAETNMDIESNSIQRRKKQDDIHVDKVEKSKKGKSDSNSLLPREKQENLHVNKIGASKKAKPSVKNTVPSKEWNESEMEKFFMALEKLKAKQIRWKIVSESVGSRTVEECKQFHAQQQKNYKETRNKDHCKGGDSET